MYTITLLKKMSADRKFKILPDHAINQPLKNARNLNYINQLKLSLSKLNQPTPLRKELDHIMQSLDEHSKKVAANIKKLQIKNQQDDPKKLLKRISSYKRNLIKANNFGVLKRKKLFKLFTEMEKKYQLLLKTIESEKKIAQELKKIPNQALFNSNDQSNRKLNNECQEKGFYYALTEPSDNYNILPEILLIKHHLFSNAK